MAKSPAVVPSKGKPSRPKYKEVKDSMVLSEVARQMCENNLGKDGKG